MSTILLGNPNPQMQRGGTSVPAEHIDQSVTRVEFWDGVDDPDFVDLALSTNNDRVLTMVARGLGKEHRRYAVAVLECEQLLSVHSGGIAPAWVDGDDAALVKAIAKHFDCPVGEPSMLLTSVGRDALHSQHLNTAAQPASFNYMAVSANATAPSTASTTLPGEITTAGGGLLRAQATYAHTAATNTSTLTKTFTANGSDTLPVTLAKIGVLNAASVGTLGYETLLNATATLTISGDSATITETVTAG
jgi:hypothetical protein